MTRAFLLRFEESVKPRNPDTGLPTVSPDFVVPLASTQTVTKTSGETADHDPKSVSLNFIPRLTDKHRPVTVLATKTITETRESPDADPKKRSLNPLPRGEAPYTEDANQNSFIVPLASTQTATATKESRDSDPKKRSVHAIPRCF
jgi:hypothetical protein